MMGDFVLLLMIAAVVVAMVWRRGGSEWLKLGA